MPQSSNSEYIFLLGLTVRSGTNFVALMLSKSDDVEVIPRNETTQEFPFLLESKSFKRAFAAFGNRYNGNPKDYDWHTYEPYLGESILEYIDDNLTSDQNARIKFIKDPHIENVAEFPRLFPHQKLIIILRDGRDIVASSEKSYLAKRNHHSTFERLKRNFNSRTGRVFRQNTQSWIRKVEEYEQFIKSADPDKVLVVRYEKLAMGDPDEITRLVRFCGVSDTDPAKYSEVEIMGSSFSEEAGDNKGKPLWKATPKSGQFKPIGRWKKWPKWKVRYFHKHAGEKLKNLGYEV